MTGPLRVFIGALDDTEGRSLALWADTGRVLLDVSGDDWRDMEPDTAARLIGLLQEARTEAIIQQVVLAAEETDGL